MKSTVFTAMFFSLFAFLCHAEPVVLIGEWRAGPNNSFYLKDYDGRDIQVFLNQGELAKRFKDIREAGIKKIIVSGNLEPWGNGAFYIRNGLKSIEPHADEIAKLPPPPTVKYVDILLTPEKFLKKTVTMEGKFYYHNPERQSFDIEQGDHKIEVFYQQLPKEKWRRILEEKNFSDAKVTVAGTVQKFRDRNNTYYLVASEVAIAEPK